MKTVQKSTKYFVHLTGLSVALLCVLSCNSVQHQDDITMSSLLREMIDRDGIARFPQPLYQSKQASSYNRASISPNLPGWFADSDGEGFIRVEDRQGQKEWVLMEDTGPGCITKIWAVCFYYGLNNTTGANIHIYLDGSDEPVISSNFFKLVKGQDFIKPPFADSSARAGNLYFPIPYAESCKITMDQKAFYNIINYRKYPPGTTVNSFTMEEYDATAGLREQVAEALTSTPEAQGEVIRLEQDLGAGEQMTCMLPDGHGAVRQLEIELHPGGSVAQALRSVVLTGTFDGEQTVWVPVGDFFNNVQRIRPYKMWERSVKPDGTMVCRWTMPYEKSAEISLLNLGSDSVRVHMRVTHGAWSWDARSMHFYATWQMGDPAPTFPLYDWNFLEAEGKGVVVGDQWTVLNPREGWWGEGDEKIYIDEDLEKNFPSHFGTGTEDYYGWAGGVVPTPADEFAKPFIGNIIVGHPRSMGYNVCTRTRVLDAIPFGERIRFDFEASCGTRQRWHYLQYAQTTFWYATPGTQHNRPPLPDRAAARLPSVEDLHQLIDKAKGEMYVVDGAMEAELLDISEKSAGAEEAFAPIDVWGDLSGDAMKNVWFRETGDFAEIAITEQFTPAEIQVCAAVGPSCGRYDISVNGVRTTTQDLYSKHAGVTNPVVDLGLCIPVDNAFRIRFTLDKSNPRVRAVKGRVALGLDYLLIDQE